MKIEEVIGGNIRRLRESADVTQEELGRRIGALTGKEWSRQAMSVAEKGGRAFPAAELLVLAHVLDANFWQLLAPPLGVEMVEVTPSHSIRAEWLLPTGTPDEDSFTVRDRVWRLLSDEVRWIDGRVEELGQLRSKYFAASLWPHIGTEGIESALRAAGLVADKGETDEGQGGA
jgi:transcriptional regulator with XRE-family HTH domain